MNLTTLSDTCKTGSDDVGALIASYCDGPEDVAAKTRLSTGTIRRLTQQGKIPHLRINGRLRYRPDAALALIKITE